MTAEEEEFHDTEDNEDGQFSLPFTRNSKRTSIATTMTDSVTEWYDASEGHEGAEVFVMDSASPDASEQISRIISDSQSDLRVDESSSLDTDIESVNEEPAIDTPSATQPSSQASAVVRRTRLPAPIVGDEGSLFAVLKKNVGKVRAHSFDLLT